MECFILMLLLSYGISAILLGPFILAIQWDIFKLCVRDKDWGYPSLIIGYIISGIICLSLFGFISRGL